MPQKHDLSQGPSAIGGRISELRKQELLTLEELAEKTGSTKSYIWELENKPNIRPSADLVYRLSIALYTTVGVLMGEIDPCDANEQDQVFFRNYIKLNPESKQFLSRMVGLLLKEPLK